MFSSVMFSILCAAENQILMAEEGGIEMLINLLDSDHELIQR